MEFDAIEDPKEALIMECEKLVLEEIQTLISSFSTRV